jgi:hypothetical protein
MRRMDPPARVLITATEIETHWDYVLLSLSDGRRLKLGFDYQEKIDDGSPFQRMACSLADGGTRLVWPGLEVSLDVWRLVEDAELEHAPWGDPPTFEGAW